MPEVSVVIPLYNAEKYIGYAIDSVLSQSFNDWEIIVIDDCSTDKGPEIVNAYKEKLPNKIYLYISEKNSGPAFSRNRGVELARGKYIAFLDSDDLWLPTKLATQMNVLKTTGAELVCTSRKLINEEGFDLSQTISVPEHFSYRKLQKHNFITCSSVICQKDALKLHPMQKGMWHEDYLCWLKIIGDGFIGSGVVTPLVLYRIVEGSLSRNITKSLKMTYNVHRENGSNWIHACYYTFTHALNGLIKYKGKR